MLKILIAIIALYFLYNFYASTNQPNTFVPLNSSSDKFVLYYAPWCGHSKNFLPIWDNFKKTMKNNPKVKIIKINCDETNECDKKNVPGFPTCILYKKGKEIQFNGERTLKSLNSFVKEHYS